MERPDDAAFRLRVETFALVRRLLPIAILVGSFAWPMHVAEPRVAMWYSAVLFCASLFFLKTLEGIPLYPAHAFGIEYRFEDDPLEGTTNSPEDEEHRCVHCQRVVDDGVHRRYARQFVVLGVPIHTFAWGENDICRDCLEAAASAGRAGRARQSTGQRRRQGTDRARDRRGTTGADPAAAAPTAEATAEGSAAAAGVTDVASAPKSLPPGDDAPTAETTLPVRRDGPDSETAIVRRVDLTDEAAALEVERAFED